MKVISIGTDRRLFEKESAVLARNIEYAKEMEGLHIIVFSLKGLYLEPYSIGNLHIYPTNSISRLRYIFDAIKIGRHIIKKRNFIAGDSVISTQDPFETGVVGYFLRRKFGFPLQFQIHTDFFSPYFKNSFLNILRVFIAKFLVPRAQGLRVVNETIKASIKKHFPNLKTVPEVLPIFVDIEKIIKAEPTKNLKTEFPQFKTIILMVSRLSKEKRIDIALRAFKKVVELVPSLGLVIAGSGSEIDNLEILTRRLGLTDKVVYIGWQDDLVSYYKTADIFLLTSEYEGYGMSLIEAAASGCPIVTTKVGIASTPIFEDGKNSFVCPVNYPECIFRSVSELIGDDEKRELFKREMQDSIRSVMITQEEYTARYVALLENLLLPR